MKTKKVMTLEEIKQGHYKEQHGYQCAYCNAFFEDGEIYRDDEHFYEAKKAMQKHIVKVHGSSFHQLLNLDKKTSSLTDIQKNLLLYIKEGKSDKEIANLTNTSASTVRHQRFVFKEKARQAKTYLALYELAIEGIQDDLLDIHEGANMVDERYIVTLNDEQQVLETMFLSLHPLILKQLPAKEKKKIIVLRKIASGLEATKRYEEKEINTYLKEIFDDYVTLRRYLVEYGFLQRTDDCKFYWI